MLSVLPRSVIRKLLFFFSWFIRQRDHDHVVRIKDKIRNSQALDTGPSDSFDRLGVEKKNSLLYLRFTSLWQAQKTESCFIFPCFPLDPALDRFSDPLFISKQDKKPQREEIKDQNGCCSFPLPGLHLRFSVTHLRTCSRLLLLQLSTIISLRRGTWLF